MCQFFKTENEAGGIPPSASHFNLRLAPNLAIDYLTKTNTNNKQSELLQGRRQSAGW